MRKAPWMTGMKKQYKKSRFIKAWFRGIDRSLKEGGFVPIECFSHRAVRRRR